jgi:hypothetical protein
MSNGPALGETGAITFQFGGNQDFIINNCYKRVTYDESYPAGATSVAFTAGEYYDNCDDCIAENECIAPSNTPSVTPTITPTVTPTITPTSSPPSYTSFLLTPCCENNFSGLTVLNHAQVLDSLSVTTGDIVSLDSICYTLGNVAPFTSSNTPSVQNTYNDCDTCLASQSQTYWCVHTYVACFEDSYGAGDLMAAPIRYNTLTPQVNPVGGSYEHLKFEHTITNIASQNVSFDDCYTYDPTYDETAILKLFTDQHNGCCDMSIGAKCGGAYVVLRSCDTYNGDVTPLNGTQLESVALMSCGFVSGSSSGGVVQLSDTLRAPSLLGSENYLGTVQDQIILEDGFDNICFTIVGQTTTLNSIQNTADLGTDWQTHAEVIANCGVSGCNCLTDVTINNLNATSETMQYLRCGLTGSGSQIPVTLPAGGSVTISGVNGCINFNSLVLSRTNQSLLGDITFDLSSSSGCT